MRDKTYEAYRATVVLLALLDTLWTNSRALAKMGRNTHVMSDLAKRLKQLHSHAEHLNKEATDINFGEQNENKADETYPKALLSAARRMNRDARAVARFFDIPTRELTARDILYYGKE